MLRPLPDPGEGFVRLSRDYCGANFSGPRRVRARFCKGELSHYDMSSFGKFNFFTNS